jgi:hypothetical protein
MWRVAELTHLPLYVVDMMQFRPGGMKVPQHEFLRAHVDLLRRDEWIIDGFGSTALVWERCVAADTLIYIDLPLLTHHRWVTKRFIKGLFADPPGWRTTARYGAAPSKAIACSGPATAISRPNRTEAAASKRVHHLRSPAQTQSFLEAVKNEPLKS